MGPAEPPTRKKAARAEPIVTGAGRVRSLNPIAQAGVPGVSSSAAADWTNVGRNDPCPCGSGKKYKKCHGLNEAAAPVSVEPPKVDAAMLGPDQTALLRPSEIAALETARLNPKAFIEAYRRVVDFRQWDL